MKQKILHLQSESMVYIQCKELSKESRMYNHAGFSLLNQTIHKMLQSENVREGIICLRE